MHASEHQEFLELTILQGKEENKTRRGVLDRSARLPASSAGGMGAHEELIAGLLPRKEAKHRLLGGAHPAPPGSYLNRPALWRRIQGKVACLSVRMKHSLRPEYCFPRHRRSIRRGREAEARVPGGEIRSCSRTTRSTGCRNRWVSSARWPGIPSSRRPPCSSSSTRRTCSRR